MASVIVPQILRDDFTNYDYWSECMRNYLLSQDLWDIIQAPNGTEAPPPDQAVAADPEADPAVAAEADQAVAADPDQAVAADPDQAVAADPEANQAVAADPEARKKDATALHAILTSCTPNTFSSNRYSFLSARTAWNTLAHLYIISLQSASQAMPLLLYDYTGYTELIKYVHRGDWHYTERFLERMPEAVNAKISSYDETALHMATRARKVEIVGKLVELMSPEALAIQDFNGDTALHLAAAAGITKMAKYMVEKDEGTRLRLVAIVNRRGYLPLTFACANGHRDATVYLFLNTPFEQLVAVGYANTTHGPFLLQCAIQNKMLDLALEMLVRCPSLATTPDAVYQSTALWSLSALPEFFPSGSCRLGFWQRWMYSCIHPFPSIVTGNRNQVQRESNMIAQQVLAKLRGICINFLTFLGIKQIYDLKKTHVYSSDLLDRMFIHVSASDPRTRDAIGLSEVFKRAIQFGISEFIVEMAKVYPVLLYTKDVNGRTPIMLSIINRQEKVFNLFSYYGLDAYAVDEFGNTVLHFAGMLSPSSSQFDRISGPALQMQRELHWYKKVESIIHPAARYTTNRNGETPAQLFTKEHRQLMTEGVKWVKDTASSCTVVGALIITIMFAAAFTVPGGVFQDEDKGGNATKMGTPIFLGNKTFKTFIISDAISLFASSASVVTFLGILTSSHGEQDFLESLPRKLIIGLSTLFISLATMMVAFCAALILTLDGMVEVIIPLGLLASVPITLFMFLQFPLLVEIFKSTYGPGIFNRKIKNRY